MDNAYLLLRWWMRVYMANWPESAGEKDWSGCGVNFSPMVPLPSWC
jgi:hypothetical protein